MRKFLLISVLLGSLALAQKNNQIKPSFERLKGAGVQMNSERDAVPRRLSYQGLLTKANGRAVSDGTYQVTFKLFEQSEGGTAFWEETQSIGVSDGVISATLGVVNAITSVPANSYLEIAIDETTLSPRQEMTSVFYSVVSDTAKYSQGGSYLDLDDIPDLSVYAQKDTLSEYPKIVSLDSVAFTGNYQDLSGRPDLSEVLESDTLNVYVMTDSLSSYTLTSNLSSVALSNDYGDLDNLPDLSQYAPLDTLSSYVSSDTLANFVSKDSVGTMAGQNSDGVSITGGSITNITDVAISDGGTGASDNSTARQNLGLEIGVDIQGYDADLADLADGSLSAEKVQFLDNVTSDVQAQINAIGDGPVNSLEDLGVTADSTELNFVDGVTSSVQDQLDAKQDLNSNLTTLAGLPQNHDHFLVSNGTSWTLEAGSDARESLGLGTIATQAANNVDISGGRITDVVDIAIADGGTGASDIATARQNLGLEIGVDVQGYDADLTDLSDGTLTASKVQYLENVTSDVQAQLNAKLDSNTVTLSKLAHSDGNIVVSDGANWTVESEAVARTSLGLGSIATQGADNVSITGGSVTGIADIAIADGGTGASDVSSARSNLGLEIGVDIQGYDADLADLADGKLTFSKVEHGEYFIQSQGSVGQVWTSDGDGAGNWGDVGGVTGAATTIDTEDLTASRAVVSNTDGKIAVSEVTSTELGYVDGVTSSIQTQLDGKQDFSDHLTDIGALAHSDGNIIVSNGVKWTVEKDSDARTSLGLGTIATQAANNVAITGGSITDITDIAVADGGTGASDVATARQNLGLEIGVDVQAYDADLADLADGELSASKVQYGIASEGTSGQVWTSDGDGAGVWGAPAGLSGAGSTIDSEDLVISRALISNASGKVEVSDVTSTELSYLDGVTSAVQTQLDAKQAADDDLTDLADGTLSASKVENNEYFISSAGTSGQVWTSDGDGAGSWVANSAAADIDGLSDAKAGGDNFSNSIIIGHQTTGTLNNASSNTAIGITAMEDITSGDGNTALGLGSMKNVTSGSYNSAQGSYSLRDLTNGTHNAAFGNSSMRSVSSGLKNSGYGHSSAFRVTTGDFNVGLGFRSGDTISTGNNNVIVGSFADPSKNDASNQIVLGHRATGQADNSVTLGNADVTEIYMAQDSGATVYAAALGFGDVAMTLPTSAGSSGQVLATNGSNTLSWANSSSVSDIDGLSDAKYGGDNFSQSLILGHETTGTLDDAQANTAVGNAALDAITSGDYNTTIGVESLTDNSTGYSNTGLGYRSLYENTTGNRNIAIGANALKNNTSGIVNVALGSSALQANTDANGNTAIGHASAISLSSGANNVSMGYNSAFTVTTGNNNVIIGAEANPSTDGGSTNQIVIGKGVTGKADNSVTIGNGDITAWYPTDDNEVDLGSSTVEFKDLYIDGTANLDAVDVDGGAIDGAAIGANSASTGAFTTVTASTSLDVTGSGGIILENDETITNSTDGTILIDGKADFNDNAITGYGADLQTESGTTKTLAATDNGTIIVCSSNSAITITVPASLPSGFNCMIIQNGSGQVSLSASSTTLNNRNGSKTAGQYAILTLVHLGSNVFVVSGDTTS